MRSFSISDQKVNDLRNFFDRNFPNFNDFQIQYNKDLLKKLYNIDTNDKEIQSIRGEIKNIDERKYIVDLLLEFGFQEEVIRGAFMNYSRGYLPIAIHVDVPEDNPNEDGDTILIPLTFNDNIKTIWWKGQVKDPIFDNWIARQDWTNKKKVNNLSQTLNLKNGYWLKPDIVDYMELDGIGHWKKGNVFTGRRSQPHCSNNFKSYGIPHKDYIIIQTGIVEK